MTLHIITCAQPQNISDCLSIIKEADALLFIENGAYCSLDATLIKQLDNINAQYYWLTEDLQARGLPVNSLPNIIDYEGFVTLATTQNASQTWG